jgi:hypothetical protein
MRSSAEEKTIMSDDNQQEHLEHIAKWLANRKLCPECGAPMACGYVWHVTHATGYWRCRAFECGHYEEWELIEDEG